MLGHHDFDLHSIPPVLVVVRGARLTTGFAPVGHVVVHLGAHYLGARAVQHATTGRRRGLLSTRLMEITAEQRLVPLPDPVPPVPCSLHSVLANRQVLLLHQQEGRVPLPSAQEPAEDRMDHLLPPQDEEGCVVGSSPIPPVLPSLLLTQQHLSLPTAQLRPISVSLRRHVAALGAWQTHAQRTC